MPPSVSSGQFPGSELDYVQITSNVTITATSDATANTVLDGNPVYFDGSLRVLLEFKAPGCLVPNGNELVLNLYDGATDLGRINMNSNQGSSAVDLGGVYAAQFLTPSAGSHTYHIKAWRVVGSGTVQVYAGAGGAATTFPAWYRITVA